MVVADGHEAVPLGLVFDLPIQFGNVIIPSTAIVVNTTSYDLVLGTEWMHNIKAIIDIYNGKMTIQWKGCKLEIPIDIEKEMKTKEIREDDYMVTQFRSKPIRRGPTSQERIKLIDRIMQDQECLLCGTKVYCAELLCTCPSTWLFEYGLSWKDTYP